MQSTKVKIDINSLKERAKSMKKGKNQNTDRILASLRKFCGMVAHLTALGFTIYIFYISKPGSSLFSWHPSLMALAFSLLMVEAVLVYSPESSLLLKYSRKTKVRVHWILQTIAVMSAILGFTAIVLNKVRSGKEHFTSWHGIFGLITVIYTTVQALCGISLLYPQFAKRWNWKLIQLKVYHATFGLLGFILACVTLTLSLYSNFFVSTTEGFLWGLCFFCPTWCALIVMNQVTNTYLPITRKSASL